MPNNIEFGKLNPHDIQSERAQDHQHPRMGGENAAHTRVRGGDRFRRLLVYCQSDTHSQKILPKHIDPGLFVQIQPMQPAHRVHTSDWAVSDCAVLYQTIRGLRLEGVSICIAGAAQATQNH